MRYFDALASRSLKKDALGRTIFYPTGALGKGHVLPDEAAEQRIRQFLVRFYQASLVAIVAFGIFDNWYLDIALILALTTWFFVGARLLVADFPKSNERLGLGESYANQAATASRGTLWALLVCCILFTVGGAIFAAASRTTSGVLAGLVGVAFFGLGTVAAIYMIRVKRD